MAAKVASGYGMWMLQTHEAVQRVEAEQRKLLTKQTRERTVAVSTLLGIAAAAEVRGAGRLTSHQLWEDGLRGYVWPR